MTDYQIVILNESGNDQKINTIQYRKSSYESYELKKIEHEYVKCPDRSYENYENVWHCQTLQCNDNCDFKNF